MKEIKIRKDHLQEAIEVTVDVMKETGKSLKQVLAGLIGEVVVASVLYSREEYGPEYQAMVALEVYDALREEAA